MCVWLEKKFCVNVTFAFTDWLLVLRYRGDRSPSKWNVCVLIAHTSTLGLNTHVAYTFIRPQCFANNNNVESAALRLACAPAFYPWLCPIPQRWHYTTILNYTEIYFCALLRKGKIVYSKACEYSLCLTLNCSVRLNGWGSFYEHFLLEAMPKHLAFLFSRFRSSFEKVYMFFVWCVDFCMIM